MYTRCANDKFLKAVSGMKRHWEAEHDEWLASRQFSDCYDVLKSDDVQKLQQIARVDVEEPEEVEAAAAVDPLETSIVEEGPKDYDGPFRCLGCDTLLANTANLGTIIMAHFNSAAHRGVHPADMRFRDEGGSKAVLTFQSFFKQMAECTVDGCETVFGNNGEAHALNRRVRKHYEKEHAEEVDVKADMAGRYYILYFYIYFLFLLFQRPGTNSITSLRIFLAKVSPFY